MSTKSVPDAARFIMVPFKASASPCETRSGGASPCIKTRGIASAAVPAGTGSSAARNLCLSPALLPAYAVTASSVCGQRNGSPVTSMRGNLTSDGARTFTYDLENRLIEVSGSASMDLAYDPLGRLRRTEAGASVTEFLYDGDRLIAEYDGSGNVLRRYAHGPGADEPLIRYEGSGFGAKHWLHADHLGSIVATSDGTGEAEPHAYGPYGEPASWSGERFRYTGQMALPEVQLYHYKARVYDPVLGRFLQTDPVGYEDQMNLYAYVGNDPVNRFDPDGRYQRGEGFNNDTEWENFNRAQKQIASDMRKTASDLKHDAAFLHKVGDTEAASGLLKEAKLLGSKPNQGIDLMVANQIQGFGESLWRGSDEPSVLVGRSRLVAD